MYRLMKDTAQMPLLSTANDAPAMTDGASSDPEASDKSDVLLRRPRSNNGAQLNQLIARCKPLDENSVYSNLLQCTHFADTSVAAESDGQLVGFISGYLVPHRPDVLFVWQVAVDESARGLGLAKRMLNHILKRSGMYKVTELHTTITPDNGPSQALFKSLARDLECEANNQEFFDHKDHFDGQHTSEHLWRIGPFDRAQIQISRPGATLAA